MTSSNIMPKHRKLELTKKITFPSKALACSAALPKLARKGALPFPSQSTSLGRLPLVLTGIF
jgi:hypothetical protein